MSIFSISYLKKFSIRFVVVVIVYSLVKLTMDHEIKRLDNIGVFYFVSAFFLFMYTWETNDWLIRLYLKKKNIDLTLHSGLKILMLNMLITLPVIALVYYLGIFEFNLHCLKDQNDLWLRFRIDFFRAGVFAFSVIVFNLFYFTLTHKKELDHKMNLLKQELAVANFQSLKDQISPHFLFNSLNTLTSLMYDDRDLAADYVNRLASCYRYILDNQNVDIISLKKELNFLDAFIFMMKIRHADALFIDVTIDDEISKQHKIPTLALQMLLENALKHNSYSNLQPLRISINNNTNKSITIKNNLQLRSNAEASTGLGINNIKKRYAYYTSKEVDILQTTEFYSITIPLLT